METVIVRINLKEKNISLLLTEILRPSQRKKKRKTDVYDQFFMSRQNWGPETYTSYVCVVFLHILLPSSCKS